MDQFLNHMRRAAEEASSSRAATRHGLVDSYDPNNHAVKVRLQPDNTLTDWVPLKSAWIGNGWGLFLAPSIGDAVEIDFQEDDGGVGSVGWRFFNDSDRPMNVPAGEAWLVHKTLSSIKLTTDGKLTLTDKAGSTVVMDGTGKITLTDAHGTVLQLDNAGNVAITGNLTVSGTVVAQGNVTGQGTSLHTHVHSGVTAGGGNSGAPV